MRIPLVIAYLVAVWLGSGLARVEHSAGCLYINETFYRCYTERGTVVLGGAQTDGAYRVYPNDIFTLVAPDGTHERAPVMGRVWVPWVGR